MKKHLQRLKQRLPKREYQKFFIDSIRPHAIEVPATVKLMENYRSMLMKAEKNTRKMSLIRHPIERTKRLVKIRSAIKIHNKMVWTVSSMDFYNETRQKKNGHERKEFDDGFFEQMKLLDEQFRKIKVPMRDISKWSVSK